MNRDLFRPLLKTLENENNVTEPLRKDLIRWAAIVGTRTTPIGRVVVEAETAEAAREKVERQGYIVLEVNRDSGGQAVSF